MAAIAQRVEGYRIVRKFMKEERILGFEGKTQTEPAYDKATAEEFVRQVFLTNDITYAIQIIESGARYVRLPSGEVVDNDEPVARMNT